MECLVRSKRFRILREDKIFGSKIRRILPQQVFDRLSLVVWNGLLLPFLEFSAWKSVVLVITMSSCRCPNYPNLPPSCIMITDPQDSCCQIPKCDVIPTPAPNPYSTQTPTPGQQNPGVSPGVNPTLAPGMTPTPGPNPYPSPIPTAVPGQIISNPDPTRPPQQRGKIKLTYELRH